jgi:hypothetical protein
MLKGIRKPVFLAAIFLLSSIPGKSQDLEVGLTLGGCYYLGDLNAGKHFMNSDAAYGIVTRYNLDTRWAVKLSGTYSGIRGDAAASSFLPDRGLSFKSYLVDISGVAEFNFMPYFTGSRLNGISPYIYAGVSVFFFDPVYFGTHLQSVGTEGQYLKNGDPGYLGRTPYSKVGVSLPFGLGFKFSVAKRVSLQVFWEMHKTFTDYLDDVSTTYYLDGSTILPAGTLYNPTDPRVAPDPTLNHQPGMQRGDASNNDWYAFFGASITYKFNLLAKNKCRDLNH